MERRQRENRQVSDMSRPRCHGNCGDFECEELENVWREAHGLEKLPAPGPDTESKEPYVPIVIIESPYFTGDRETNMRYLRAAIKDCLLRGEAPFASHAIYTLVTDDNIPEERQLGIQAGFAFRRVSDYTVVYEDFGITSGMQMGIDDCKKKCKPIFYRSLPYWDGKTK